VGGKNVFRSDPFLNSLGFRKESIISYNMSQNSRGSGGQENQTEEEGEGEFLLEPCKKKRSQGEGSQVHKK